MEVWKDIPGYEGKYQVSSHGRVKSLERYDSYNKYWGERILKPLKCNGYYHVALCNNGKIQRVLLHRLVAKTFIDNPDNKPEINHINGIKTDNRAENLEWNTRQENEKHAYKNGLAKHYTRKVLQFDLQGNFIKEWESSRKVESTLCIPNQNVAHCCNGRRKTAGGYIWKYKEAK